MCMWWGIWLQSCTYATIYEPEGCTSQWRGPQELCTTHRNRVQWNSTPWDPHKEKGFANRFIGEAGQWYVAVPVLYQKKHCKFTLSTNNEKIAGNVSCICFFVQITSTLLHILKIRLPQQSCTSFSCFLPVERFSQNAYYYIHKWPISQLRSPWVQGCPVICLSW